MRLLSQYKGFKLYKNDDSGYTALAPGQIWGARTITSLKHKIDKIGGALIYQYHKKKS